MKKAAGFVIFRRFNKSIQFLLLQTIKGRHHWTPPKGHVDPGESDLETAYRETREEAGILNQHLKVFENKHEELHYKVRGGIPKTCIYWLAELLDPETPVILSDEHQKYAWESLEKACELANFANMVKLLKEFSQFIDWELC